MNQAANDLPPRQADDPRFPSEWFPELEQARIANRGKELTLWDVFAWVSTPLSLAAVATLLSPQFVEVRGCVLRADRYWPETFARWWEELRGDRQRIEAVVNHEHLADLYLNSSSRPDRRFDEALARVVARCWRAALAEAYPERSFAIEISGGDEAEITFWGA